MERVKVFNTSRGQVYKVKVELEFYFPELNPDDFSDEQKLDITPEEALRLALDNSRNDLGEKVLNSGDKAEIILE